MGLDYGVSVLLEAATQSKFGGMQHQMRLQFTVPSTIQGGSSLPSCRCARPPCGGAPRLSERPADKSYRHRRASGSEFRLSVHILTSG